LPKNPSVMTLGTLFFFQCIHVKVDENRLSAYNSYDPCRVNIHTGLTGGYNAWCCFDGEMVLDVRKRDWSRVDAVDNVSALITYFI
jgi:hypothetical protein